MEFPVITIYLSMIANGIWRIMQHRHKIRFYPLHLCWIVAVILNIFATNNSAYYSIVNSHLFSLIGFVLICIVHLFQIIFLFPEIIPDAGGRFSFVKFAIAQKPVFYSSLIVLTLLSLSINYYQAGYSVNGFVLDVIIRLSLCFIYFLCINNDTKLANWLVLFLTIGVNIYYVFFRYNIPG